MASADDGRSGSSAAARDADSGFWPTSFALTELTDAGAAALAALVRQAVGRPGAAMPE